ncbi:ASCH domain-containing protein [Hymenobacter cellulosivorans]|uniref:ASCH domain-containing protein n=1 Tax=Hymenobacter cellulosivorans TaxID=2932249 RepID=A0ABY4F8U7_9BACT|nr:ASCH domain-containing protein [Hymenobacter cellulosivorans]UOQ53076.1 ASCH domain-containing protein [Hymenobacter cellulosivorans]
MKALSLIQPYATLIMLGYKQYETRSWDTKHRGPLAIHASVGKPAWARQVAATCPEISAILQRHGLDFDTLPRGVVLGTCEVVSTHTTLSMSHLSITELACGDYTPGRYAWRLIAPLCCNTPVPCKGALSLWSLPAEVEQQVHATSLPF